MPALTEGLKKIKSRLLGAPQPVAAPAGLPFPETLQIETSYQCNLKCFMCPRSHDADLQGQFPVNLFRERVAPHLSRFRYVHLAGWGEPTMHKQFVEILEICRDSGCWFSFTTNGLLLKEPLSRRILETGVRVINISCDGSKAETYEQVRGKGTFDVLMKRMAHMRDLRREMNATQSRLEWTFVMMKANLTELPDAVRMAGELGFDRFTAKHMETAMDRPDMGNALWETGIVENLTPEWEDTFQRVTAEARAIAAEHGIEYLEHPRRYAEQGECLVRPSNHIFIDYKGRVSNCCYLNKIDVKPYIAKADQPNDDGVYGDLQLSDFIEILDSAPMRGFRETWRRGEVPEPCRNCIQVNRMNAPE
jgi:MoaA/NifB/PqqE/SkfB family radical SAM enzyme